MLRSSAVTAQAFKLCLHTARKVWTRIQTATSFIEMLKLQNKSDTAEI